VDLGLAGKLLELELAQNREEHDLGLDNREAPATDCQY
jgi:hypothetical protein